LKELVVDRGRKNNGVLVIRPDSGDPPEVVVKVLNILRTYEHNSTLSFASSQDGAVALIVLFF